MVGFFVPARFALRRLLGALVLAAALVPATLPAPAAAASTTLAFPLSPGFEALVERARAMAPTPLATVAGQELVHPGRVRQVGFHESGDPTALPMSPAGRLQANHNGGRISLPRVNGGRKGASDVLVEIVPEGRPDLAVRMMHIEGVRVQEGDKVEAGRTVVAAHSRLLPFPSQIDRFAGSHPHVHLEVLHRP